MELYDKQLGKLTVQVSPQMEKSHIPHGFTTRAGGVSQGIYASLNLGLGRGDERENVLENYGRVCAALSVDITKTVLSVQVHRDDVRRVNEGDWGKGLQSPQDFQADSLITDTPGTTLVVFGADCLTALFYDPAHNAIGAAHAGWRGTAMGILEKTVVEMQTAFGTNPEELIVALGPCISACCFETDGEVPQAMREALGEDATPFLRAKENGKWLVDLKGLNTLWLKRAGVLEEHIDISPDCTLCKPQKYWSHRYTKGERGSQASLISLDM